MVKLCKNELLGVDLNDGISAKKKSWVMTTTFEGAKSRFVEATMSGFKFGQKVSW